MITRKRPFGIPLKKNFPSESLRTPRFSCGIVISASASGKEGSPSVTMLPRKTDCAAAVEAKHTPSAIGIKTRSVLLMYPLPAWRCFGTLFHYYRTLGSVGGAGEGVRARRGEKPGLSILADGVITGRNAAQRRIGACSAARSNITRVAGWHSRSRRLCRCCARRCRVREGHVEAVCAVGRSRCCKRVREKSSSQHCEGYHRPRRRGARPTFDNCLSRGDRDRVREKYDPCTRRGGRDGHCGSDWIGDGDRKCRGFGYAA